MEPIRNTCSQRGWYSRAEAITVLTQWGIRRFIVRLGGGSGGRRWAVCFVLFCCFNPSLSSVGL